MNTFSSKQELLDHVGKRKRVLVLFCASWCPFCQEFFPTFENSVKKQVFDEVLRVYIDDYDNPLWDEYSLEAVPCAMIFEEGEEIGRIDARLGRGLGEKQFTDWLKKTQSSKPARS